MDLFIKLFGDLLTFVYHCFDRIVIHGYLTSGLFNALYMKRSKHKASRPPRVMR